MGLKQSTIITIDTSIHNIADLYELTPQQITSGNDNRLVSAKKVVKSISDSKEVPFERVVFALGIRFVGETTARLLARHFKDMDTLASASLEELLEVDGVGEVIAESVIRYFHDEKNIEILNRLREYGLQMRLSEQEMSGGSDTSAGQSVVISGVFTHHSRDEYKAMIERHGGKNVGSISGKTSFVLAGDNMGPSKLQKAERLGVKIVSEDEFLAMVAGDVSSSETVENTVDESGNRSLPDSNSEGIPQQLSFFD